LTRIIATGASGFCCGRHEPALIGEAVLSATDEAGEQVLRPVAAPASWSGNRGVPGLAGFRGGLVLFLLAEWAASLDEPADFRVQPVLAPVLPIDFLAGLVLAVQSGAELPVRAKAYFRYAAGPWSTVQEAALPAVLGPAVVGWAACHAARLAEFFRVQGAERPVDSAAPVLYRQDG